MKYAALIAKMKLEEKASLLSGDNFWQSKAIERLGIPAMSLADGPHGVRRQEGDADHLGLHAGVPATCFPTASAIANSWDIELGQEIGELLGKEAAHHQVDVLLGPGLNVKRSPLCGRNFEYFSEDPVLSGKMAAAYIRGIQTQGVAACPKHFAANSQEYLRMTSDSIVDKRTLHEIYLTGFEIAVKEGKPKTIMSSYNKINGTYANENRELLRDVLVDHWGFEGIVVSDWGGSNDYVAGVIAGSHLEMPATGGDSAAQLVEAVKSGLIAEEVIDQRVNEFLRVLFELKRGDFREMQDVDFAAHHELARKASEESIVLLKNKERTLPLQAGSKVAVIGDFAKTPRYQGAGSSMVNPVRLESTLDVMDEYALDVVGYEQGYLRSGGNDSGLVEEACRLAEKAEVVLLYIGLPEISESEGLDRSKLSIPQNQIELLKAVCKVNENVVVVISGGSVIEMPWMDYCKAAVHGYLAGQAGAGAMLNVLTGKRCPSGKLSETIPESLADTPTVRYFPGQEATAEYREGLYVGYRYYDTAGVKVRFPFGFGLSYTTFAYSGLKVSGKEAVFTITNTGDTAGSEIAQLYVGKENAAVFRPKKELKGFAKVFLEPGEEKEVTIALDDWAFRYFNVLTDTFEVEPGVYDVMIGASSADIRLMESAKIKGTDAPNNYDREVFRCYFTGDVQAVSDETFEALLDRPIPEPKWDRSALIDRNDSLMQMEYAKSPLARSVCRVMNWMKNRSMKKGKPNLNLLFVSGMPFRGIAKMMDGAVSMEMVDALLIVVNGRFFRGSKRLVQAWHRHRKAGRIAKSEGKGGKND